MSNLYFSERINGAESDVSFFARLDTSKTGIPASLSQYVVIPSDGTEVDFIFWRDSGAAGANSGGLFQSIPARAGGKTSPSATISILRIG